MMAQAARLTCLPATCSLIIFLILLFIFPAETNANNILIDEASSTATVSLKQGSYKGIYNSTLKQNIFYAIPYAQPPVGNLRFRAPKEVIRNASVVFDASKQARICIQSQYPGLKTVKLSDYGVEDCLYVNIFAPVGAKGLDVMIWFHGGGFITGSSSTNNYPGYNVVQQSNNSIVHVTFQYRVGGAGFLASSKVAKDGDLNVGLLDQRAVLKWAKDNIENFGGDPNKVLIYGESAGGNAVLSQLIAYGGDISKITQTFSSATPLFRAAIMQSSALKANIYKYNSNYVESQFKTFASAVGCDSESTEVMECLRSANLSSITNASNNISTSAVPGQFGWNPVVDGHFYQERPSVLLAQGKIGKVPVVVGYNTHEGSSWVPTDVNSTAALAKFIQDTFPSLKNVSKMLEVYPDPSVSGSPFTTQWQRAYTAWGEDTYICSARYIATNFAKYSKSWKYNFDQPGSNGLVGHGGDVVYTFGNKPGYPDLSNTMMTYFSTFAKSLKVDWTVYNPNNSPQQLRFRNGEVGLRNDDVGIDRCKYWESVYDQTGQ